MRVIRTIKYWAKRQMESIGVIGGDLGDVVGVASNGSNGIPPAETNLEGLLGNKDTIRLDLSRSVVYVNDDGKSREINLGHTEFNLLEYLMRNAGRVVPYHEISREVFGYDEHDRKLQVIIGLHVNHLRQKIGQKGIEHIQNIHGFGYKFIAAQKHATDDMPLGSEESLLLYPSSRQIYVNDNDKPKEIHLFPTEFNLLKYLMRNACRVVPYHEISREVFGYDEHNKGLQRNISSHVSNLRQKIGDNSSNPVFIQNIYGFGYKFIGTQNNKVV